MKPVYYDHLNLIKDYLTTGKKRGEGNNFSSFNGFDGIDSEKISISRNRDRQLFESLKPLSTIAGKNAKYHEKLGAHPDFSHLKETDSTEKHYITSVFIDIKNSTNLFRKYYPDTVANITKVIQRAAIHTCWYFDGYVQRLHGDGLFIYFGGKSISVFQSTINAINAASFFAYFVKNDLKKLFREQGVEDIYIRIGIDTGLAEDTLWHLAGISECSEVTTCGLHTSLAAKMQGNAESNGIVLGDHVKSYSSIHPELFSIIRDKDGKESRYIFQIPEEGFNYTQWKFGWEKYLMTQPGITEDENGHLYFRDITQAITPKPNLNINYLKENVEGYRPYYSK